MQGTTVVPHDRKYDEALRLICMETGNSLEADEAQKTFLLSMYCDCYLEQGHAFVLLGEEEQPQGYIFYAEDYESHAAQMQPYLEKLNALGNPLYPLMAKAEMGGYEANAADYPAHLHVDIREAYTGSGNGSKLMEALLAHLRSKGVPGIMLQVAASNERAIKYYRKHGFETLSESPMSLVLGKKLA